MSNTKAAKRVQKKRTKQRDGDGNEPSKEELAVAKYVRFKCPTKSTVFAQSGDEVHYFVGSKAVDSLLDSKWSAKKAKKTPPLFTDRQSCVDYLQELLSKGLFYRAKKLVPKIKEKEKDKDKDKDVRQQKKKETEKAADSDATAVKRKEKEKKEEKIKDEKKKEKEDEKKKEKEDEKEKEKEKDSDEEDEEKKGKKKTRKAKLLIHDDQVFIDGTAIYIWKYDPTPLTTFILGLAIVIGAIGLCLFPLWPPIIRVGVYYLSLAAMGFVIVFVGLVVFRVVLFGGVWLFTLGRHHFWLLPNLVEDCGFWESFKPAYTHKYVPAGAKPEKETKKKRKKSESTDEEEEPEIQRQENLKDDSDMDDDARNDEENDDEEEGENYDEDRNSATQDEDEEGGEKTGSESEEKPTEEKTLKKRRGHAYDTRQDSNNGDFEIIEKPVKGE